MKPGIDYIGNCVVFFCHDGEGNYLLARRSEQSRDEKLKWDVGGGKVEFGQTREEALRDELLQEYGVRPIEVEFLGVRDAIREEGGTRLHWIASDYRVRIDRAAARLCEPHKHVEMGWFQVGAFPPDADLHSQLVIGLKLHEGRL